MKSARPVVLDACVLIPMPLADTLLRLAAGPRLFLPKWSDQIMEEVTRTLPENFGLSAQKAISEVGRDTTAISQCRFKGTLSGFGGKPSATWIIPAPELGRSWASKATSRFHPMRQ